LSGPGGQVQSQQLMLPPPVTQQPEAYQVVLITHGFAQTAASVQCSQ
jgi:hypothetical protein